MRVKFTSLEQLQESFNKTYKDYETEKRVEETLDKEIEVYFDEHDLVYNEANEFLGELIDY